MRKLLATTLATAMILSAFAGCSSGSTTSTASAAGSTAAPASAAGTVKKDAKDINVVFIPKLSGNAFFESANVGAQDMAKKVGFSCKYDGNPQASVANQVQIINSAVTQGADAVAISAVDPNGLNESLKAAKAAGVKVVCWDSDVNNQYRSLHVAQGTPEQLGQMLVDMAAMQMTDAQKKNATFVFHYSSATVADQNSWVVAARAYVKTKYPGWKEVSQPYYSEQDAEKAISVGESVLKANKGITAVICPDSTALPGQAQAAKNLGMSGKVIITGFATPSSMKNFCLDGTVPKFGLWDCKIQGAMGAYLGYWLAAGNTFKVGDDIDIPDVGKVKVQPNTVLDPKAYTADDSGVVVLPERVIFDKDNVGKYNF